MGKNHTLQRHIGAYMPTLENMQIEEDMITALINDMKNWDFEYLLSWAQDQQRVNLESADREEIQAYYSKL